MSNIRSRKSVINRVNKLATFYEDHQKLPRLALDSVAAMLNYSDDLTKLIHSTKSRVKSVASVREKLFRKFEKAAEAGEELVITDETFFDVIKDCAGFRILHLHTTQVEDIHKTLLELFEKMQFSLVEEPFAVTWDLEYKEYFTRLRIQTQERPQSYYTSVHYVVRANEQLKCYCEIQLRTLAEELWGEVDHSMNYPTPVGFTPCAEELRALARVTSSCTRLVDAIYASKKYCTTNMGAAEKSRPTRRKE